MKSWTDFYGTQVGLKEFLQELDSHSELINSLVEENPVKILEVGIGSGRMSIFLSWLGLDVVGIDNNKKIIETASQTNKNLNGSANFQVADAFDLPYKNNSFDCTFSQGIFEHFQDDEIDLLLKEQQRVAKTVIFSVPNNHYKKKDLGNERLLSKKQWDIFLKEKGYVFESKNYRVSRIGHLLRFILRRKVFYLAKVKK